MEKYYKYLGLHLDKIVAIFQEQNINYTIKTIKGKKDQEKLIKPRVIKISEIDGYVELIVTYFSDSLS